MSRTVTAPGSNKGIRRDIAIVGGGLAGTLAAIAAAREGRSVALLQDRPMLGGNSSSEVRVSPVGADFNNRYAREGGILEELRQELVYRDRWTAPHGTGRPVPLWDAILWEWVEREPNLSVFLNTRVIEATTDADQIVAVKAYQMSTELGLNVEAAFFVDATGDGSLAHMVGADYMMGRESTEIFGEQRGMDETDRQVMSPTITFSARDTGEPVPFFPPAGSYKFLSCDDLPYRLHTRKDYGYWWIEYGGELDPIADAEQIREELHKILFGVWDHIKNHCDGTAENYALDFVGSVLGKRESRRIVGDHVLIQPDLEERRLFRDRVATGGWPLDHLHPPAGIFSSDPPGEMPQRHYMMRQAGRDFPKGIVVKHLYQSLPDRWPDHLPPLPGLYSIPLRSLYAAGFDNLFLAGRNVSASHVAFGSLRVQGTTATIGQAVGTAAAICVELGISPQQLASSQVALLQQTLIRNDAHLVGVASSDELDHARTAKVTASSSMTLQGADVATAVGDTSDGFVTGSRDYTIEEGDFTSESGEPMWSLDEALGQMFPVNGRLNVVSLLLTSLDGEGRSIPLRLHRANELGIFEEDAIAEMTATLPPGSGPRWVDCAFDLDLEPGLYWIEVGPVSGTGWLRAVNSPIGTYRGAWMPEYVRWERFFGTHAFRLNPAQRVYEPGNVVSGVSRPERDTNIWISNPDERLPALLNFEWASPVTVATVQITFDTNLDSMLQLGKVRTGPSPESVADYAVEVEIDSAWREVYRVTGNYQRANRFQIDPVTTRRLRLVFEKTNGIDNARVYEVRIYGPEVALTPLNLPRRDTHGTGVSPAPLRR